GRPEETDSWPPPFLLSSSSVGFSRFRSFALPCEKTPARWPMKRLVLVLCALVAAAVPARAFVPQLYEDPANGISLQAVRWPEGTNAVPMMMNDQALQVLPSIVSSSTPVAAIQAALHTWAIAPLGMYYGGSTG